MRAAQFLKGKSCYLAIEQLHCCLNICTYNATEQEGHGN